MRRQRSFWKFFACLIISSLLFLSINVRRGFCDDCVLPVGRPFPYKITSGYATPERWLWRGAISDLLLVFGLSVLLLFVWQRWSRCSSNGVLANSPLARPMNSQADHYLQATLSAAGIVARKAFMSRIGGWPNIRLYSRLNWLTLSYPTSNAAPVASNPSMSIRCLAA
jgi:hypothetical protein